MMAGGHEAIPLRPKKNEVVHVFLLGGFLEEMRSDLSVGRGRPQEHPVSVPF